MGIMKPLQRSLMITNQPVFPGMSLVSFDHIHAFGLEIPARSRLANMFLTKIGGTVQGIFGAKSTISSLKLLGMWPTVNHHSM